MKSYPEVHLASINHSNYMVCGINLISMLYKIQKGLSLAFANTEITHIVRTRPDLIINSKVPRMPKDRMIVAKQSSHLGLGIGDNLHIGPSFAHAPVMRALENLPQLFERTRGILCPHLMMQAALDGGRAAYSQKRIKFQTLHTPGGMYKAQQQDGSWTEAKNVDYTRSNLPFRGSSAS